MKFGIVIPTYRKLDGSTYAHLSKALFSIKEQTHQDFKVFLIGDDYDDNDELLELSKIIPEDKMYVCNLPVAVERSKYDGYNLWVCGGVNALNIGINQALLEQHSYLCLLGHDDYYFPNHLETLSKAIEETNAHFLCTKCGHLPDIISNLFYINYRPIPERVFGVSTCIDFKHYPLRPLNTIEEFGYAYPNDADLWKRLNALMSQKNENGIFINITTCAHPTEGHTLNHPEAVKKRI